nr:hypothetical protein [Tanacetum cinerariifolium]
MGFIDFSNAKTDKDSTNDSNLTRNVKFPNRGALTLLRAPSPSLLWCGTKVAVKKLRDDTFMDEVELLQKIQHPTCRLGCNFQFERLLDTMQVVDNDSDKKFTILKVVMKRKNVLPNCEVLSLHDMPTDSDRNL